MANDNVSLWTAVKCVALLLFGVVAMLAESGRDAEW